MSFSVGVTILIYVILIVTALYAMKMEMTDLRCPSTSTKSRYCGPGKGVAYFKGKPSPEDDVRTLLEKISLSSSYEENTVKWRRCLIFSLIITLIFFLLVLSRLPNGNELLIGALLVYVLLYFMMTYYQSQVAKPAVKQIDTALKLLEEKLFF